MVKTRLAAVAILLVAAVIGYGLFASQTGNYSWLHFPFKLGLDLNGGTQLIYRADITRVAPGEEASAMSSLREVIERRVNLFGVSEPLVQTEKGGIGSNGEQRLIVELPGITDIDKAVALIGKTPLLEFRALKPGAESKVPSDPNADVNVEEIFLPAELTGRQLDRAILEFDQRTGSPIVSLQFNSEGKEIFAKMTRENVGRVIGIFLDDKALSVPVVREEIRDGKATITGSFTPDEAKELVRNLNYGALPVPIELIGSQTIGPSLGARALHAGLSAGLIGFLSVALFLLLWYRLPGLMAILALIIYTALMLALFKLIPVTLTAAGLAGFILSIGMAVDANILIFERMKEELRKGKNLHDATHEGFSRAWLSIRDSNLSSMITAAILFWLGTTAVVKGFALVFGIGVLVSMFTAITVTRTFLFALGIGSKTYTGAVKLLFGSGLK